MKTKVLTFLGLVVAGIGALSLVQSSPVFAAGEAYRWDNETQIEASGGLYSQVQNGRPLALKRVSAGVYTAQTEGGTGDFSKCGIEFRLQVGSDNVTATMTVSGHFGAELDCEPANAFDKNVKVSNPNSGPPMDGSEVDYRTVNCATYYEGGVNAERCEAIKKCIAVNNNGTLDCLRAFNTCIINYTANGSITTTDRTKCATLVAAGDLAAAANSKPPASSSGAKTSNCKVDGIGWLLCPVLNFSSLLIDKAYGFISDSLLKVEPLSTNTDDSNAIFKAWSLMRNFANVVFIIAFLLIIFSQVTSTGISNYGIKKMLPKLILAAGLVNVSYWLCAIGVDLSNISQASIYNFFKGIQATLATPNISGASTGEGWAGVVGFLLAGAGGTLAIMYVGLAALIPILITVGLSILSVVLLLIVRQALIIILIILSPLAFVSMLLPNTDGALKLWWSGVKMVVIVGPLLGVIVGGSALASTVIMASSDDISVQIIGLGVGMIPLAFTWLAQSLVSKFGKLGAVLNLNDPNKGPIDGLKKKAGAFAERRGDIMNTRRLRRSKGVLEGEGGVLGNQGSRRRRTAAWLKGAGASASLNSAQRAASAKRALQETQQDYVMERVAGEKAGANGAGLRYAQSIAGPTGDAAKVMAAAVAGIAEEFAKEVKAQKASLSRVGVQGVNGAEGLSDIVYDARGQHSAEKRAAAASLIAQNGGDKDIHDLLNHLGTAQARNAGDAEALKSMQQQVGGDLGARKPLSLGGKDMGELKNGVYSGSFVDKMASRLEGGKVSAESMVNGSKDELEAMSAYLQANQGTLQSNPNLQKLANDLRNYTDTAKNPNYAPKSPESAALINNIKGLF